MNKICRLLTASLALLSCSITTIGQVVAIAIDRQDVLYLCEENDITIAVEGVKCSSLVVTSNNGSIQSKGFEGQYVIKPDSAKPTYIYVDQKLPSGKLKRISEQCFRYQYPPLSEIYIGVSHRDTIYRHELYNAQITTDVQDFTFSRGIPICGFTVVVKRNGKEIYNKTVHSDKRAYIDSNIQKVFYILLNNDSLIFKEVKMRYCNGVEKFAPGTNIGFVIADAATEDDPYRGFEKGIIIEDPITGEVYERVTPFTNRPVKSTTK